MSTVLERSRDALAPLRELSERAKGAGPPPARWAAGAVGLIVVWLLADNLLPRGAPLGIIVLGLVFGSLYGLLAIGVVLIYRANRVVNFAQAEIGGVAAVLAIQFVMVWGWNYFQAIGAGFVIAAVMGGLINAAIIRRFQNAPRLIVAVATIGLAQLLNGAALVIPILMTGQIRAERFTTPFEVRFEVFPAIFTGNHVMAMVLVPLVMIGLMAFLRYSDYGIAIRASAENGDRANLLGVPVPRLSTIVWAMAGFLSALAVILRVPIVGFASFSAVTGAGNSLLLRTLAAAVIGRMENLPRTVIAALALGVFQEVASWTYANTDFVDALLVLVILGALLVQRDFFKRAQETGISTWRTIREVRPIPHELRKVPEVRYGFAAVKLVLLAVALAIPLFTSPSQAQSAALVLIYSIVAISLLILTGWAGHISLGQFALVGFGAATTAVVYQVIGLDYLLGIIAGVIAASLVALVIGLPALRIKGPFLAVTTLAFAVTSASFFLEDRYFPWFITERVDRPVLWGRFSLESEAAMYYFCLAILVFAIYAAHNLRKSRTGRALIAIRDNEGAAETFTLHATKLKLLGFVISGAFAGLAGAVYVVHQRGVFTGSFDASVSIQLFSMVVIGGLGSLPGAIMGAIFVRGAEGFLPGAWAIMASGMGILVILMFIPEGIGGMVYQIRDGLLRRIAARRGIIVPSLVADISAESEYKAPTGIDVALGGFEADGAVPLQEPSEDGEEEAQPALEAGGRR